MASTFSINHGCRQLPDDLTVLFRKVVKTYVLTKQLPVMVAKNYDLESPSKSRKLSTDGIHYIADVERITEQALTGLPDSKELQETWFALAQEQTVSAQVAKRVIHLCAPRYRDAHLEPFRYFSVRLSVEVPE
jgi:hypothetical protein